MKNIKLTQGKIALVDDECFQIINKYKWHTKTSSNGKRFYAKCCIWDKKEKKYNRIYMHRMILNVPKGFECDHIDRNGLNNQTSNLRICTSSQNSSNTELSYNPVSRYRGVTTNGEKWKTIITKNNEKIYLGIFKSRHLAAVAYNVGALKYHGEFARLNEIQEGGE